jgi:hypothetical protein
MKTRGGKNSLYPDIRQRWAVSTRLRPPYFTKTIEQRAVWTLQLNWKQANCTTTTNWTFSAKFSQYRTDVTSECATWNQDKGRWFKWKEIIFDLYTLSFCRSRLPGGLRRGSAAIRLLGLRVRIPPGSWISVVSVVLSGRGPCDGLITRPEESWRIYVCVCLCVWGEGSRVWS